MLWLFCILSLEPLFIATGESLSMLSKALGMCDCEKTRTSRRLGYS